MSSCCTSDGSCSTGTTTETITEARTTVYQVTGMTCGHCESSVSKAVGDVDGVLSVDVDVEAGLVTLRSLADPDDALIAKAVDEAGYEVTGRTA
ncbi:copper-binding protein [Streptomyces sp. SID4919]|uniref:heavy-metal-associated domain-containing protein n=1 Tax=unclassified Streptomyces TaxID=2593676 RepID=UPI000823D378|nr:MULTISPECIES: heavy-metal-associated domain-containing protein [unclassified Streptomyces]MYY13827.1 copper-binding protein [Streptomyces sp. SID4919]SCK30693.1 Copper chaperone CopZ [Streptomyces sp. AmelKG-E11A]